MANLKSSIKRAKTNEKSRLQNKSYKTQMKNAIKTIEDLIHDNKKDEALKLLPTAHKKIDKALKKNIIHKKKAGRLKSKLTLKINKI